MSVLNVHVTAINGLEVVFNDVPLDYCVHQIKEDINHHLGVRGYTSVTAKKKQDTFKSMFVGTMLQPTIVCQMRQRF
jgi:hypothetical protein